jgi:hypothetical protein
MYAQRGHNPVIISGFWRNLLIYNQVAGNIFVFPKVKNADCGAYWAFLGHFPSN